MKRGWISLMVVLALGSSAWATSLLNYGDFEADPSVQFRLSGWTAGTSETGVWHVRNLGTGGQDTDYLLSPDPAIQHYVEPGGSGPGVMQGIAWPGAGTVVLEFDFFSQMQVNLFGADVGESHSRWNRSNNFDLLWETVVFRGSTWGRYSQEITLTGDYDYLVVKFGEYGSRGLDNVSLTALAVIPEPLTALAVLLGLAGAGRYARRRGRESL